MKQIILSLSVVAAALIGVATPAQAQSDLFFQGLKDAKVLNIKDVTTEAGVAVNFNDPTGKYSKTTIKFDDFFGGVSIEMFNTKERSTATATLDASMTLGAEGYKGDTETLYQDNDYILGFYDFNMDGMDEIVIVARSKNEEKNQMAMLVAFPCSEINGNFAMEEVLGDAPQGLMTAVLENGLITVTSVSTGKVVYRLKWNTDRFETIYD